MLTYLKSWTKSLYAIYDYFFLLKLVIAKEISHVNFMIYLNADNNKPSNVTERLKLHETFQNLWTKVIKNNETNYNLYLTRITSANGPAFSHDRKTGDHSCAACSDTAKPPRAGVAA